MTPIFDQLVKEFYGEEAVELITEIRGGGRRIATHWVPVARITPGPRSLARR